MQNKIYPTMTAAVAGIPDGASIMVGGFGPGTPYNLITALHAGGAKALTIIANNAGGHNPHDLSLLVKGGQVRKMVCAFTASAHPSRMSAFEELYARGEIEAELVPQGTLAERIRAGGAGIPAFYTPTGAGTELAAGREVRVFDGRTCLLETALTADYALVRAWKADSFGNLIYRRSQRNFNPIMAMAARCTIAEVEEPIVEPGALDPDCIHTPGIFVHRIMRVPEPPEGILHVIYGRPATKMTGRPG